MSPLLATFVCFCFLSFSSFSSVTCSLPSIVFFHLASGLVFVFVYRLSHPLSSSFSSAGAFVPTASVVLGVASSALGDGSDGTSLRGIFSAAPVPEDSVAVFGSFGISG